MNNTTIKDISFAREKIKYFLEFLNRMIQCVLNMAFFKVRTKINTTQALYICIVIVQNLLHGWELLIFL